jgi:hypothetical protein
MRQLTVESRRFGSLLTFRARSVHVCFSSDCYQNDAPGDRRKYDQRDFAQLISSVIEPISP